VEKHGSLTQILAVAGTVLAWLPLAAPLIFAVVALMVRGRFLFDYLMPAEIFPVALLGSLLLLWAAWRARARRKIIAWGLGLAVAFLVGGQALAVVTGLASGETEMGGWQWTWVVVSLIGYCLALAAVGVGGILLLSDLFTKKSTADEIH